MFYGRVGVRKEVYYCTLYASQKTYLTQAADSGQCL